MKKSIINIAVYMLAVLLAAVACNDNLDIRPEVVNPEPKESAGTVTLKAVIEDNITKSYLDSGNYVCWSDGDNVWINGKTYTVHVDANGATITGVTAATQYACVYPASVVSNFSEGCKVKITLPQAQTIAFDDNGRQVLSLPMAAYGDGTKELNFKNLCGLVGVTVSNTTYESITPASMILTTSGDVDWVAPLYGQTAAARDLSSSDLGKDWAILASNIGNSGERGQLNITVSSPVSIDRGGSRTYYVTVPVIDDGTKSNITLEVSGTVSGDNAFKFKKTTSSTKTIARNCIGTIPVPSSLCYEIRSTAIMPGKGTQNDPYQVSCPDQFCAIRDMVENRSVYSNTYFLQVCDIDFGGAEISPIGGKGSYTDGTAVVDWENGFPGIYDGNGFKISNFKIHDDSNTNYCNLYLAPFAFISGGTLKNLTVDYDFSYLDYSSWGPGQYLKIIIVKSVGGIVGYAGEGSVLSNLEFIGELTSSVNDQRTSKESYFGGIVAVADNVASMNHLTFNGTMSSDGGNKVTDAGGIAGKCSANSISHCVATESSNISLKNIGFIRVGGLFGSVSASASINDLIFAGKITLTGFCRCLGGVAGMCSLPSTCQTVSGIEMLSASAFSLYTDDLGRLSIIELGGLFGHFENNAAFETVLKNKSSISFPKEECAGTKNVAYVGGIAGVAMGKSPEKVENSASIIAHNSTENIFAGGLYGYVDFDTSIITSLTDCTNTGNIIATSDGSESYAGGLIGYWKDKALHMTGCSNSGKVEASAYGNASAAGLIACFDGSSTKSSFESSSNSGTVTATSGDDYAYAGGLLAYLDGNAEVVLIDKFRNSGAITSIGNGNDDARAGGVIGSDDDNGYNNNLMIFNSENTGNITATCSNDPASAGGIIGYHDSDGGTYHPCVINCCNRGTITATAGDNSKINCGGLIGYCYFSDNGTSIRADYSRCKYFSENHRAEIKCGGLSGTKVLEYDCYWSKFAHDGIGMLDPNYSWENGESDKGTAAFTGSNSDLVNNLNAARSRVPTGERDITYPALLEWTTASDGYPTLSWN